jgi:hypothetical protein
MVTFYYFLLVTFNYTKRYMHLASPGKTGKLVPIPGASLLVYSETNIKSTCLVIICQCCFFR